MTQEEYNRIMNPDLTRFKGLSNEQMIMLALAEILFHMPASIEVNELKLELLHRSEKKGGGK